MQYIYLITDDVITVTRRKLRQFDFSLHTKINHIEFEDKFSIKTHENVKDFCQKTAIGIF